MKTRHTIYMTAKCPENNGADYYRVDVFTDGVVKCEDIVAACNDRAGQMLYQEVLTQQLATELGSKVRTIGGHCGGVVTSVCVAAPDVRE